MDIVSKGLFKKDGRYRFDDWIHGTIFLTIKAPRLIREGLYLSKLVL